MGCKQVKRVRLGFTLLELLVVVAILAIIAGGLIAAYDGLESQAGAGTAANSMAAIDQAVRTFTTVTRRAPSNMDSLVALASPTETTGEPLATVDELFESESAGQLPHLTIRQLSVGETQALAGAGIMTLRYVESARNVTTGPNSILLAPSPNRVFDDIALGGRGFAVSFDSSGSTLPVAAIWNANLTTSDSLGLHNRSIGAGPTDVLVALGLGNNATLIGNNSAIEDPNSPPINSSVTLAQAPFQVDEHRAEYNRFILLYNLGPFGAPYAKAKFHAVINSHGKTVDQKIAEYTGQTK